jgi:hypothetical protein
MILRAHGTSSAVEVGRQVKIFCRLAVVEMPVVFMGPRMTRSRMCGSVVMPLPPEPPPA